MHSSVDDSKRLYKQHSRGSCSIQEYLQHMFRIFDSNNDGVITTNEMNKLVTDVFGLLITDDSKNGHRVSANALSKQVFHELDADRNCEITRDEFVNRLMHSTMSSTLMVALSKGVPTGIWETVLKLEK